MAMEAAAWAPAKVAADKAEMVVAADKAASKVVAVAAETVTARTIEEPGSIERRQAKRMQIGRSMRHSASPFGLGRVPKTQSHEG